jgi:hypothetical protein
MSQMIGFDRKLQLSWLDATVGLVQQAHDTDAVADELRQRLASEIRGDVARRKTVTVLLRLWVNIPQEHWVLRDEALEFAAHLSPRERPMLHWGMSLLAYPFFRDVAATVGGLGRLQEVFSMAQVQRRMVESWGQRSTLVRAVQRLVRTFYAWGMLLEAEERGSYRLAPAHQPQKPALVLWLLNCALLSNGSDITPLQGLAQRSYLFPFELTPFLGDVRRSSRFQVTRQGLDLEMVSVRPPEA